MSRTVIGTNPKRFTPFGKAVRERLGQIMPPLTLQDLARDAGIGVSTLRRALRETPAAETVVAILNGLGVVERRSEWLALAFDPDPLGNVVLRELRPTRKGDA